MKKTLKIITIMLIVLMMISVSTVVFADDFMNPKGMTGQDSKVNTNSISDLGQNIIRIVGTVGMIAAVVVLIVLGIKYMMGSAEEKAEYKKTMLPYVIGAVLIFAASSVVSIIAGFGTSIQA